MTENIDIINISGKFYSNELLAFLCYYIHNSAFDNIKKVVIDFYSDDDILDAKKLLWEIASDNLEAYT